jgi:transposase InsO family protein
MPWQESTIVERRTAFVLAATRDPKVNLRALCRHFGISPTTGYQWLARAAAGEPLVDRSRRPHTSPRQTPPELEAQVLALRDQYPAWGGRKLRALLIHAGDPAPSASTMTAILRRHGRLPAAPIPRPSGGHLRFEAAAPNLVWQMDFKSPLRIGRQRCFPLTVLDDHSRFAVTVAACRDQTGATVQAQLIAVFRRYGMPERMLMDNGAPWSATGQPYTRFSCWLLRLGIRISHGRPRHPQTQGKDERFHRTLTTELLATTTFADWPACQAGFDLFRERYNTVRPHEALDLQPPATRYQPSPRPYPDALPPLEFPDGVHCRQVQAKGEISFRGQDYLIGKAFTGEPVGLLATDDPQRWSVWWGALRIGTLDLARPRRG